MRQALPALPALAQVCPFDDGNSSLAVEGLILTRYALGLTGAPLVASTSISAVDAPTVEASINCPSCGLNITGNATMTVAEATIISRKLAGFSGAALTDNLNLGSGTRNTPAAVQSFLLAGCGATGGTVTSITAGSGLTGGTITASGTIAVDTAVIQSRVIASCAVGSSIRVIAADGTVTCQTDNGGTGGGGTVTSITAGTGLTGGTISTSETVAADTTFLQRRVAATCQTDTTGGAGTVTSINTGAGLSGGPISATGTINLTANQLLPTTACAANQIAKWSGTAWACAVDDAGPANAFVQGGNTFSSLGAGVASQLGNNDTRPLTLKAPQSTIKLLVDPANGDDGLRISYATDGVLVAPNTINGSRLNSVAVGVVGATIGGGGDAISSRPNQVNANFGTIGGGRNNTVSSQYAVVAGGESNTAGSGGNVQRHQTVGGGTNNVASGAASTVPGGVGNQAVGAFSFAAGRSAHANHQGAFVWGDDTAGIVASTGVNQFVIRANGGIRLPGAGENQPDNAAKQSGTNMFTHVVPATGPCRGDGPFGRSRTAIEHPLINGKPDAILVVTPNIGTRSTSSASYSKAVSVMYDDDGGSLCTPAAVGRWMIVNAAGDQDMVAGLKFNVFVLNP